MPLFYISQWLKNAQFCTIWAIFILTFLCIVWIILIIYIYKRFSVWPDCLIKWITAWLFSVTGLSRRDVLIKLHWGSVNYFILSIWTTKSRNHEKIIIKECTVECKQSVIEWRKKATSGRGPMVPLRSRRASFSTYLPLSGYRIIKRILLIY